MLAIKLAQTGKTNKKMFRLIISEKSRDPYGRVLEILGAYNPHTKELSAKKDRIKYWLSQGAQMTPTVNNLLVGKEIVNGDKVKASRAGQKNEKRAAQLQAKADKNKPTDDKKTETKDDAASGETPATTEPASSDNNPTEEAQSPTEESTASN